MATRHDGDSNLAERTRLKRLLAENPNYFGNLEKSPFKPVKKIISNTEFEEITCAGYNPDSQTLEATIAIKQPSGYNGDLCHPGSIEYVRFFVDYGAGWEDAGYTGVSVHDIPNANDCANAAEKPLLFAASLKYTDPKGRCCGTAVLPRLRAILSWQWLPPAGAANAGWTPIWGNVKETNIQIKPLPFSIWCLIEELQGTLGVPIKLPPLYEAVQNYAIPLPDPGPLTLSQVAKLYGGAEHAAHKEQTKVEAHRYTAPFLQSILAPGGFDAQLAESTSLELKAAGLDLAAILAALDKTTADVAYEQLECLALDEVFPERLVATFRIKRPLGYSGTLCQKGSYEYVAFWADWDNNCQWTYLNTVAVNVHDFQTSFPNTGVSYSAILPVNLSEHRRSCKEPKIGRVRAVLSWATPPSTSNPDELNYWGNRIDTHVLIEPGTTSDPGSPKIRNIGGIPVENIDGSGLTNATAVFADFPYIPADQWGLNRPCPFGGSIRIDGDFYFGYWYRLKVKRAADPPTSYSVVADPFDVEKDPIGFDHQVATGGFFPYLNPATHFNRILGFWSSSGDVQWQVQLEVATGPSELDIISSSIWYTVQLDNTAPETPPAVPVTLDIHIAAGGDCKDASQGTIVSGNFIAEDLYFGGWSLSTEPNTLATPSNQPAPDPFLAGTDPAPGPGGHGWKLDTGSPIQMKPCGYVVRLDASDRSIVGSYPGSHNSNHIEVGFCLRAK